MKKILPFLIVLVFIGVGYYVFSIQNDELSVDLVSPKEVLTEEDFEKVKDTGTLITAPLMEMVNNELISFECQRSDSESSYKAWTKGGMLRMEYFDAGNNGSLIVKDDCIFSWEEESTVGIVACYTSGESSVWDSDALGMSREFVCSRGEVDDIYFERPLDMTFSGFDM